MPSRYPLHCLLIAFPCYCLISCGPNPPKTADSTASTWPWRTRSPASGQSPRMPTSMNDGEGHSSGRMRKCNSIWCCNRTFCYCQSESLRREVRMILEPVGKSIVVAGLLTAPQVFGQAVNVRAVCRFRHALAATNSTSVEVNLRF